METFPVRVLLCEGDTATVSVGTFRLDIQYAGHGQVQCDVEHPGENCLLVRLGAADRVAPVAESREVPRE